MRPIPEASDPHPRFRRFSMIEIALALVVLALGLSAVLALFPVGANASRTAADDRNIANIAEQVAAFLQTYYTAPAVWREDGSSNNANTLSVFRDKPPEDPEDNDKEPPISYATPTSVIPTGFVELVANSDSGLYKYPKTDKDKSDYFLYRQYTDGASGEKIVEFETRIRVGLDTYESSFQDQFYLNLTNGKPEKFSTDYDHDEDSAPMDDAMPDRLKKFHRALIVEISWPVDAPWASREKRIFRLELFNENFIPYPQSGS